ncbi:MAG: tetraacyldisaccharide 4'-kinase [Cyclobacteriaceae bacterium]|nr:tetraacyldisaccharide 4'-kinase [Cyclobacteriaceae bacterium]
MKILLYPFAMLYNLGTRVRNYLFDIGHKPSFQFDVMVISVGNLNVGGSGKTPMVEYIIRLLKDRYRIATLSRGYKRRTKGFRTAQAEDTALHLGDEPMQMQRKFGDAVRVTVGEDRVFAIPNILQEFPDTDVVIMDDAFQHRAVNPQLTVLVTDFAHPFYKDHVMPFGRLREARRGAQRADIIVVTKCPGDLSEQSQEEFRQGVFKYAPGKPVLFSTVSYDEPRALGAATTMEQQVILVTGIAKTTPLLQFCQSKYRVIRHFQFDDHHHYTQQELDEIERCFRQQSQPCSILTTEKDMVKLIADPFAAHISRLPWFYIPIRQEFVKDGLKFDTLVLDAIKAHDRK